MVSVVADRPEIERCLNRLIKLSENAGAEFSADLIVKCVDGYLSIEAPPGHVGEILMRLPWDSLIPLEPFQLVTADDNFVISSYEPGLTDTCIATMETMLELYNLTNKFATHRSTSPWHLIASYPELLPDLLSGINSLGELISHPHSHYERLIKSGRHDEMYLRTFLHTRSFGYNDGTQLPPFQVLMPILDAMNHHHSGALYTLQDGGDRGPLLAIARSTPVPTNPAECFARYGLYDCLELWLSYGFVDENWQSIGFVRPQPMTIELPGVRKIRVTKLHKLRDLNSLPESVKDIGFLIPQIIAKRLDQIVIGALAIPGPQAPRALRRSLHFLLNELSPGHPRLMDLIYEAERQIVTSEIKYYENLLNQLRAIELQDQGQRAILKSFIHVCTVNSKIIQAYIANIRA